MDGGQRQRSRLVASIPFQEDESCRDEKGTLPATSTVDEETRLLLRLVTRAVSGNPGKFHL